jgi:hypothetical protein
MMVLICVPLVSVRVLLKVAVRSGAADLAVLDVSTFQPICRSDLPVNWPVEPEAAHEFWWSPIGAKGYNGLPNHKANWKGKRRSKNINLAI